MILDFFKGIISIPVPFNMIVLIVLFGCMVGAITAIAQEIRKYLCHRQDIDFKRELVERGLSGEEIERIVAIRSTEAGSPGTKSGNNFANAAAANS